MRYLAIARFRLLTTIRSATALFVLSAVAVIAPGLVISYMPVETFRVEADELLPFAANVAFLVWAAHAIILLLACNAFGDESFRRAKITSALSERPPDLIDTAPIRPGARFWGETVGILAAAMTIHVCTLPALALVTALSPLPTSMFITAEIVTFLLIALASAGGAWKRRAPMTKWNATRGPRSALLFGFLLLMIVRHATHAMLPLDPDRDQPLWNAFRDSLIWFVAHPSPRAWSEVSNAVGNPLLLLVLVSTLYTSYIVFYYKSCVRKARRQEN